jgi:hypothetical protein
MTSEIMLPEKAWDRLIDAGNTSLNDFYHERACACSLWPGDCFTRGLFAGMWDTNAFAIALPAIIAEYEKIRNGEQE